MSNLLVPADAVESVSTRYTRLKEAFVALVAIPLVSGEEPPAVIFGRGESITETIYIDEGIFVSPARPGANAEESARTVLVAAGALFRALADPDSRPQPFGNLSTISNLPFVFNAVRHQFHVLLRNITAAIRLIRSLPDSMTWASRVQALRYELAPILDTVQAQTAPAFGEMTNFLTIPRPVFAQAEAQTPGDVDKVLRDVPAVDLAEASVAQLVYSTVDMATAPASVALGDVTKVWRAFEAKTTFRQMIGMYLLPAARAAFALETALVTYNLWHLGTYNLRRPDTTLVDIENMTGAVVDIKEGDVEGRPWRERLLTLYNTYVAAITNMRLRTTDEFVLKVTRPAVFLFVSRRAELRQAVDQPYVWNQGLVGLYRTARYVMEHLAEYLGRTPATAVLAHLAVAAGAARVVVEREAVVDNFGPLLFLATGEPTLTYPEGAPEDVRGQFDDLLFRAAELLRLAAEYVFGFRQPPTKSVTISQATVGSTLVDTLQNIAYHGPGLPFVRILVPLTRLMLMPFRTGGAPDGGDPGESLQERRLILERFLADQEGADALLRQRVEMALQGEAAPELVAENRRLQQLVDEAANCRANEAAVREARAELEEERQRHQQELDELTRQLTALRVEESGTRLQETAGLLEDLLESSDARLRLKREVDDLTARLAEIEAAKDEADARIAELARSREVLEGVIETTRNRAEEAAAGASEAEARAAAAETERESAESRAAALQEDLDFARAETTRLAEETERLQNQVEALEETTRGQGNTASDVIDAMNVLLDTRKADAAGLRDELADAREKLNNLGTAHEEEVARLRESIAELTAERDAFAAEVEELARKADNTVARQELEDAEEKLARAQQNLATQADELTRVRADAAAQRDQLAETLARIRDELQRKDARITELEAEVAQNEQLVSDVRAAGEATAAELERQRSEAGAEAARVREELGAARTALEAATARAEQAEAELGAARTAVDAASAEADEARAELAEASERHERALAEGAESFSAAQKQLCDAQARVAATEAELEEAQRRFFQLEDRFALFAEASETARQDLEEQLATARGQLVESGQRVERAEMRVDALRSKVQACNAKVGRLEAEIENLQNESNELKTELNAWRTSRNVRRIAKLEKDLEDCRVRLDVATLTKDAAVKDERTTAFLLRTKESALKKVQGDNKRLTGVVAELRNALEEALAEGAAPDAEVEFYKKEVEQLQTRCAAQEDAHDALAAALQEQLELNEQLDNALSTAEDRARTALTEMRADADARVARLEKQLQAAKERGEADVAELTDELANARADADARAEEAAGRLASVNESLAALKEYICVQNTARHKTVEYIDELNARLAALRDYVCARSAADQPLIGVALLDHPVAHIGRFFVADDAVTQWERDWRRWTAALRRAVNAFNTYVVGVARAPGVAAAVTAFDRALRAHFVDGKPRVLAAALARLRRAVDESSEPIPDAVLARFALLSSACPV